MQEVLAMLENLVNCGRMSDLTPAEAAKVAIDVLGGPVKAARLVGVKGGRYQTVQSWLANRVPAEYCPSIEEETAKRGRRIPCEWLRPDVAWQVLREAPDALPVAERAPLPVDPVEAVR